MIKMGKLAQSTSKYVIIAHFDAEGTVEKPDVIGAVFGQTEGLLGQNMDLRELQSTGRIGRIDVEIKMEGGKAHGRIFVPSSLDASETAMIAACIETIERIGPCNAKLKVEKIDDVRVDKRKFVVERAKELLGGMFIEGGPEAKEISEQIKESVRTGEIVFYRGLPAGPDLDTYDEIIVVEGRADVLNLLRYGIKNVIAIEGTSVPQPIAELSREKEITVFLDGDRGGDLNLKELMATCEIDYVARAPEGKEVEELTKKEVFKALRERVPSGKARDMSRQKKEERRESREEREEREDREDREERPRERRPFVSQNSEKYREIMESLTGTRAAYLLDESGEILGKVPVKEMFGAMREIQAYALLFDGDIDQKLINFAMQRGVKLIIGMKMKSRTRGMKGIEVLCREDL